MQTAPAMATATRQVCKFRLDGLEPIIRIPPTLRAPAPKSKQPETAVSNGPLTARYFFAAFIGSFTAGNVWNSTL
jgi:hypothetical protein